MNENFGLIKTRSQLTRSQVYTAYQQAAALQNQPTALQQLADHCSALIADTARAAMQERNPDHVQRMFAAAKALDAAFYILNSPANEA